MFSHQKLNNLKSRKHKTISAINKANNFMENVSLKNNLTCNAPANLWFLDIRYNIWKLDLYPCQKAYTLHKNPKDTIMCYSIIIL